MAEPARADLFHRIAEKDSADARRRAAELGVLEKVEFRNVHFESHRAALAARGGERTPALWDGSELHVGREAVLAALERLARGP
jgi:hypothetical protein